MKRIVITLFALMLVFTAYVNAETIKLSNGSIIQGTVVSGTEKGVEIKLVKNNATVNFSWNQLDDKDRLRIRKRFGLEMPDYDLSITVMGDRVETFKGEAYIGKIESEDASKVVMTWLNDEGEKEHEPILRRNIRNIYRNIAIPAYILMLKEDVYDLIIEEHPPSTANDYYLLAMYCKEIGFYEKGIEHIEDAVEMDPKMEETCEVLKAKLQKLISAGEFSNKVKEIQNMIKRKKLGLAYMDILQLQKDEQVDKDEDLKNILSEVIIEWELQAAGVVAKEWFSAIKSYATKIGRDRDVDINGARQYAYGQMDKDIQEHILEILNKDLVFTSDSPSPIDAKLIGDLFKKRDKKSYSAIKIILNAEAYKIKLSGSNNKTKQESEDPIQQLKDAYEKYRSGEMTDEEKEEFLKKYGKYFRQPKGASKSIDPDAVDDPLQQSGGRTPNGGRATRDNPDNSKSSSADDKNKTKQKKLTLPEVWEKSGSTSRKAYIIYLYCKKKKEIQLKTEKMKGTTYYAWFN